jgi:hypothetical protein
MNGPLRSLRIVALVAVVSSLLGVPAARAHDPHPSLEPLAFLAGTWVHEEGPTAWEETWSTPTGDSMTGMTKQLDVEGTRLYEMQAIEVNDGGTPVLMIRHFGRGLEPSESERGGAATFPLSDLRIEKDGQGAFASGRVAFSRTDPRSHLPQRILYVFPDPDSFTVTVEHGNVDDPNAWFADQTLTFHRLKSR